jgi:plastocyanin
MTLGWKRMLAGGVFVIGLLGAACSNYGGADNVTPSPPAPASSAPAPTASGTTGGGTTTGATTGGAATCDKSTGETAVALEGFAFKPPNLLAKACTTVNLSNKDTATHTFTIDGSPINVTLPGGADNSAELELAPGTYTYYCRFHGSPDGTGMAGKLTVS